MLQKNTIIRTEEKVINILLSKIKQSKLFYTEIKGAQEIYYLDGMDINLDTNTSTLEVTYKSGKKVISMNCAHGENGEQNAKVDLFSSVLKTARKRNHREQAKKARLEKLKALNIFKNVKQAAVQTISSENSL